MTSTATFTFYFNDAAGAFQINRNGKFAAYRETLAEVRAYLTT